MSNIGTKVTSKVQGDRSILERIAMYIPFYRGYKAKELRRDTDREVRNAVSKMVKAANVELANVHRDILVETGDTNLGRKVERIRNKLDTYNTRVSAAVAGYSGLGATVKKLEKEFDAVIEFDADLLDSAADVRNDASVLLKSIGSENMADLVYDFERKVDTLIEVFEGRELVLKGLEED